MGFLTPTPLPVEPEQFLPLPLRERLRILALDWVDNGFGTPRMVHMIYLLKIFVFYIGGGIALVSLTSDVGGVFSFADWWKEPIVYQKLILWTVLLEILGIGGSWGPLAAHFKPMTGGFHYWLRPGTIRLPPWPGTVPLTSGDRRTVGDVLLYGAVLVSLAVALVLPGVQPDSLQAVLPDNTSGVVRAGAVFPIIGLLVLLGLRDKTLFLAARGEQYLPAMVFFATLGFVDMIIALKLLIVVVWVGAGVSKFGEHFINVVPPMVSNAPFNPFRFLKRLHYRNFPEDIRPSKFAWFMAHVGGTMVEIVVPLILLFTTNPTIALLAACFMVFFHVFIASTFPLAVPLEWNVLFAFASLYLFVGHQASDGYGVFDFSQSWMLPVVAGALVFFPVLGNLRPDLVSFLPSMRQYAGNWASALWAFAPGCEQRLNELDRPAQNQIDQLVAFGYEPLTAEVTMQKAIAWRSMHSQGRGLFSLMLQHLPDPDGYTIREAEFGCNSVIGWNFGDGHLHDEQLIQALQRRLDFAPGEFVIAFVESQPIHKKVQRYRVIDAALGVVERGSWKVDDAVQAMPWLPDGPIPIDVEWTRPGYVRGERRQGHREGQTA
jgi:uncharacterized membrane protein YkgB